MWRTQVERLEDVRNSLPKGACGAHHVQNDFLLQASERLVLLNFILKVSAHFSTTFQEM